ncbi:MAG: cation acetate symporter [Porticoccaceae bacterium]|nr:MAG: cation acetate symporter [Porticoccaceae bacterium]
MSTQELTYIFVGLSFALYILIAIASRVKSTKDFYVAGSGVNPVVNGMATAADWMSAASFLSMAGIIAFLGRDGSVYLMGWTGGYVLLALLLAPYLRKFGKYTVPDFIGTRYYSRVARVVAVVCLIFVSFTYVAGQMRGVGIVFSRFLEVDINTGVIVGMAIVFIYAVLGGMKGITYTQVAQYCVLIFAYLVPAIFISIMITGNPIPQLGLGTASAEGTSVLTKLDNILQDLGFSPYTSGVKSSIDVFAITAALMFGTAGLPHVLVRFFTVPKVADARKSAGYALVFIAILYTTAPAVASFARLNIIDTLHDVPYSETPAWVNNWENTGLIAWLDKNDDGIIQYGPGSAFSPPKPIFTDKKGDHGQRLIENKPSETSNNEIYIDRDIIVLANPEIAGLPGWVIALVAAGGVAAALSTAAGLLLVISSAISHDLLKKTFMPKISDRQELLYARISSAIAICVAGLFGIYPPAFVAQVVAFAFGLAASSLFPLC